MMSENPKCGDCMFYHEHTCHRFPPQIFVDVDGSGVAFPVVNKLDWCGEFKPREIDESSSEESA